MRSREQVAAFGGGCHWCTEAVFQHVAGVTRVEQGFACGPAPYDAPSEAARVAWNPRATDLSALIGVHLDTHAAGAAHAMRAKYRSAIYVTDEAQAAAARSVLDAQAQRRGTLVTQVLPLRRFSLSPERYRDYYRRRPDAPFCRTHIAPKLARIGRGALPPVDEPPDHRPLVDQSVTVPPVRKADQNV